MRHWTRGKDNIVAIQLFEREGGKILEVHVSGKLTDADYQQFIPRSEELIRQHGKLSVLFDMSGLQGWDMQAAWDDIKFSAKHFSDLKRVAMVGEKKWQQGMTEFCKPFTKAQVRYFEHAELPAAHVWLEENQ